jgi:hypothetical protein
LMGVRSLSLLVWRVVGESLGGRFYVVVVRVVCLVLWIMRDVGVFVGGGPHYKDILVRN